MYEICFYFLCQILNIPFKMAEIEETGAGNILQLSFIIIF